MKIQSPLRTNCCDKESHFGNILHDICGRKRKCCKLNCEPPTAISYGYQDERNTEENLLPTVSSDNNAFFTETSGARSLTIRQACSVESFARLNPNITVYVFLTPNGEAEIDVKATTMHNLMENYSNIRFRKVHLDGFYAGTPLEQWYYCSDWNYSPFAFPHLSDSLRLVILFKYGGYYFDMEIMHLNPIEKEFRNFLVNEHPPEIKSRYSHAAIHFEHNNPFVLMSLGEYRINYRYIFVIPFLNCLILF